MQWENLTSADFQKAVEKTGVCVIAMGIVEKHAEHLPLGTDYLDGHKVACLAAEKEPAVVFPPFYFGQMYDAGFFPGTINLKPTLLVELILDVFDEIGRNGFGKIVVYNAHGGNNNMLPFMAQCSLWEEKPYCLYLPPLMYLTPERDKKWKETLETKEHHHACECETSISLANHPHLVKMDRVPKAAGKALNRMKGLPPTFTGVGWYSNYPTHYAGDARSATKEKGMILRELLVASLAEYIAAVKADRAVPKVQREFYSKVAQRGLPARIKASARRAKGRG